MVTYSTTRNLLLISMILSFSPNFAHGALINYIQDNRNTVVSHLDINGNLIKETLRPSPAFSDMTGYGQYSVLGATWMNGSGTGDSFVYQEKAPTFDVTFQLTESATISMSGTLSATPQIGGGAVLRLYQGSNSAAPIYSRSAFIDPNVYVDYFNTLAPGTYRLIAEAQGADPWVSSYDFTATFATVGAPVPLPASALLLASALLGLIWRRSSSATT